jgi:ABC-type Mn2+/Zn2+ transport system ATPase subunit
MISVRDLEVAYGSKTILKNVSLDVEEGSFWALTGPNGEGKSSFVKVLTGLLKARSGKLQLRGIRPREISYVPQYSKSSLELPMTLEDYVQLAAPGFSFQLRGRRSAARQALAEVGLAGRENERYETLSGGQMHRAQIARALLRKPRVLILDEPYASLDFRARESLTALLKELNDKQGMTILVISHDLDFIRRHSPNCALFSGGEVVSGATADVLSAEALQRIFGTEVSV